MGPESQYTDEKPEDPIELRIYPGADGSFELFQDDGLTLSLVCVSYGVLYTRL
jgi:alpha-D-xyloside xylohydrolase